MVTEPCSGLKPFLQTFVAQVTTIALNGRRRALEESELALGMFD
jgi:hypothetical protein